MSLILCDRVEAAYNGHRILRGIDLRVGPGEWVTLIGPNGAGKSTLLRVIGGSLAGGGDVRIDGHRVGELSRRDAARLVAIVPQHPVFPDGMRVFDYVLLGRTPYVSPLGVESKRDVAIVRRVLHALDLVEAEHRPLTALSGGERQRAVVARALAQEAPILLLDEPTTALDIGHAQHMLELVDRLRVDRGLAVLSAMHDLTVAGQYSERLVLVVGGEVVAQGPPSEVLTAELMARHYQADVAVVAGPDGNPIIAPYRR